MLIIIELSQNKKTLLFSINAKYTFMKFYYMKTYMREAMLKTLFSYRVIYVELRCFNKRLHDTLT